MYEIPLLSFAVRASLGFLPIPTGLRRRYLSELCILCMEKSQKAELVISGVKSLRIKNAFVCYSASMGSPGSRADNGTFDMSGVLWRYEECENPNLVKNLGVMSQPS